MGAQILESDPYVCQSTSLPNRYISPPPRVMYAYMMAAGALKNQKTLPLWVQYI